MPGSFLKNTLIYLNFILLLFSLSAWAADFNFNNVNEADLKKIIGDFSGNFVHTSVSGASSLGRVFGFELGLAGGISTTPGLNSLIKEANPLADDAHLIHGGIVAQISIPFGLTFEGSAIPSVGNDTMKITTTNFGLRWTMTDTVFNLPFSLALKAHTSRTSLRFATVINNSSTANLPVDSKLELASSSTGLALVVSKELLIFEPYFGIGMLKSSGEFRIVGSGNIFDSTLTSEQSANASTSGIHFFGGTEVKLFFLKAGLEYSKMIDVTRVTGKLALSF